MSDVDPSALPQGVVLHPLVAHVDRRGAFTEIFRAQWALCIEPVQWNAVRSEANVLRGVHVHTVHADYLTLLAGEAVVGLKDLRRDSPTGGLAATVAMSGGAPAGLVIPPGVAHGFYFKTAAVHIYAVNHYWHPEGELGCHWADPRLGIAWTARDPVLSARDAGLPSLAALERSVAAQGL